MRRAYAIPISVLAVVLAVVLFIVVIILFSAFVFTVLPILACMAGATAIYNAVVNGTGGELDNTGFFAQVRMSRTTRTTRHKAETPPADAPVPEPVPRSRTVELS